MNDEIRKIGDLELSRVKEWISFGFVFRGSVRGFNSLKEVLNEFLEKNKDEIRIIYQRASFLELYLLASKGNLNFKEKTLENQ